MGTPRLSDAAEALLAGACEEARRRGHARYDGVHVLAALATEDTFAPILGDRGVDREELRLLVDAVLGARAGPASYRDVNARPIVDDTLDGAIAVRRRSWLSRLSPVGVEELVDVVVSDPASASLVRRATSIVQSLQATLQRVDRMNEEPRSSTEHVLRLLADERWFVFATRSAGGDVERLREVLDDAIAGRTDDESRDVAAAELSSLVHRTLAHAKALGKRAMADLFVVRALQTERIAKLFDSAGVRATKLLLVLVHGEVVVDDDALGVPSSATLEVVFHDDDITTMDFVVTVLGTCFDLADEDATALMLRVHETGSAVVATLPADEARQRVALAREMVRAHSSVLRISLRRAT